ncbi:SDR family oxidoreductase [Desulfocapsa sp. AH-315-G09]|uniref:SDR family oxidoreductase n=1 Tax=Desulfotalea psychrophila TaxID=84980 RepID=A0ABS3AUH5_9BACT|nr:SDR family oxidoreductase [Desulfocapsa sp.]MBN4052850.1 SDR family oxidoreductase [bacterium AH-315-K15]MBN4060130.1 SDR family oxidoreductase [Desulfotalea psychrophila]MBN4065355.1 SDR family oxidoreductase [Desulfocapsa sp. AH-315-G09]MBN4068739.1 SDR family oxidoreductase [Desulfotalea psychrophila]
MKLSGKTALVPGASRPIGRAIARKLGEAGVQLILPTFDWPESIIEMEDEFKQSGFSHMSIPVDLRSEEAVKELMQKVARRFKAIHILVNNIERGGMPIIHGSYDLPHNSDQWDLEIASTLKAKWLLFHHSLPLMQSAKEGAVVNISSVSAMLGRSSATAPFFNDAYSAANRAISSFTETWAREAAPTIRVNELMLGLIRNRHGEDTRGWGELNDREKREIFSQCLLERTGTPEEVATAALFLIRDADYMTGSVVRMDGGVTLGSQNVPPMPDGILQ